MTLLQTEGGRLSQRQTSLAAGVALSVSRPLPSNKLLLGKSKRLQNSSFACFQDRQGHGGATGTRILPSPPTFLPQRKPVFDRGPRLQPPCTPLRYVFVRLGFHSSGTGKISERLRVMQPVILRYQETPDWGCHSRRTNPGKGLVARIFSRRDDALASFAGISMQMS